VLQTLASGFFQRLYPPVGTALGSAKLANGSSVETLLNGFQLIPVNAVASAASAANFENSAWLQGQSGCNNAIASSNNYFYSPEYLNKLNSTANFYQSVLPVINGTFTSTTTTFKNAYTSENIVGSVLEGLNLKEQKTVYDSIHVSQIHSETIPADNLLTDETVFQLQTLADDHEYNLDYNASEPIRAIAGSTLAAQVIQQLNMTITGKSNSQVWIQFGAYASFLNFFGLSQLPSVSENFTGIIDYTSSMTFELIANAAASTTYPTNDQIFVRFLFSNGTAAASSSTDPPLQLLRRPHPVAFQGLLLESSMLW
jgi:hypothetical protein